MNNTTLHWTEDPALLEQFVMGQIPEDRMIVLNEHLGTCTRCLKAVEAERDFVRSVRAYGRDQLKARLKERLERRPSRAVPWPHVLSAAAVVIVIVGLGIYNGWWREERLVQSEEEMGGEKQEQSPPSPAEELGAGAGEGRERALQGAGDEMLAGKVTAEGGRTEIRTDDAAKDDKGVAALRPEQPLAAADADAAAAPIETPGEFWVDGILTDSGLKEKMAREAAREADAAPAAKQAEAQKSLMTVQQRNYQLMQLPEKFLPMQQKQFRKGADQVPTKVEPRPDGALLTAYTDQFDLRNRTIQGELAGADSVVFIVDGIRIAYKLSGMPVKQ